MDVIIASGNKNKLKEIKEILKGYNVISMADIGITDDIIEDGDTFEENALIKAKYIHEKTGKLVLSDDSGLCVKYLNDEPGVYSARYAGEEKSDKANNNKLLKNLENVPFEQRGAKFVCAVAIVFSDGTSKVVKATAGGTIGLEEAGDGGFGYDPLFICEKHNKTYAELTMEEKNLISHRKKAFEKAKDILDSNL